MFAIEIAKPQPKVTLKDLIAIGEPYGNYETQDSRLDTRKHAPAIAIAGAALSVKAGIAIGASTLLGGMMIAGGVASGLGALTGNKTLSTIGTGLSLASGIGTAFFSQGANGALTFANPFKDGNFGNSIMGKALSGLQNDLGLGGADAAGSNAGVTLGQETTGNILDAAKGGNAYDLTSAADNLQQGVDLGGSNVFDSAGGSALNAPSTLDAGINNLSQGVQLPSDSIGQQITNQVANVGNGGGSSGGFMGALNTLGENKGLMSALTGVNNAYQQNENREFMKPTRDENNAFTNAKTQGQLLANQKAQDQITNMDIRNIDVNQGFGDALRVARQTPTYDNVRDAATQTPSNQKYIMYDENNRPVILNEQEFIAMQNQRRGASGLMA